MTRSEIEQALRMARAYAAEKLYWFASALYSSHIMLTGACPFIAAIDDGMRVYFNPKLLATLLAKKASTQFALPELAWIWVHEICHRLREHSERVSEKDAEPLVWNAACDCEVNDSQWQGLEPPELFPPLLPSDFKLPDGRLAEFYYDELLRKGQVVKITVTLDEGRGVHGQRQEWELPENDEQAPSSTELEIMIPLLR